MLHCSNRSGCVCQSLTVCELQDNWLYNAGNSRGKCAQCIRRRPRPVQDSSLSRTRTPSAWRWSGSQITRYFKYAECNRISSLLDLQAVQATYQRHIGLDIISYFVSDVSNFSSSQTLSEALFCLEIKQ